MMKPARAQYKIQTCPSNDFDQLENLLNSMSEEGWELYSMHEVDTDDGYQYNCIFVRDAVFEDSIDESSDFLGFRSKMERIMNPILEPFDICMDIQKKIKDKRAKINQIKSLLDSTSDDNRDKLNDEISVTIKELNDLKQKLLQVLSPEIMHNKIGENKLSITLSEELLDLISPDKENNLISQIVKVRQNLTESLGYIIPKVHIDTDDALQANEFSINVRAIPAIKSFAYPGYVMYFRNELNLTKLPKDAIKDVDYITGKQILWIEESKTKDFWTKGLSAIEYISRVLDFVSIKHIEDIFDYSDVNRYIEIVGAQNLYLIENIIPDFLSIAEIKYILSNLIKENVSIKDIFYIFEKINDFADDASKEDLLGRVRIAMSRQISKSLANKQAVISAFELSDKTLNSLIEPDSTDEVLKVNAKVIEKIASKIEASLKKHNNETKDVILIAPMNIRQLMYLLISKFIPNIKVVSKEEILFEYQLEIIDYI